MDTFIIVSLVLILITIWIYAIIDILKLSFRDSIRNRKWLLIITFLPFLGSILYLITKKRNSEVHRKFNPKFTSH
uniref:PLDc N-terminal domain-containing protein n=1 Tax=Gelidibacter sp. TaxID=2018083 RepID=UPI00404A7AA5